MLGTMRPALPRRERHRGRDLSSDSDPAAALPAVPVFSVSAASMPVPRLHSRNGSPTAQRRDSFDEAMHPVLLAAKVFGVLPLHASPRGRAVRTGVLLGLVLCVAAMAGASMVMEGIGLASSSSFVFYSVTATTLVLLGRLSSSWEALRELWKRPAPAPPAATAASRRGRSRGRLGADDVRRVRKVTAVLLLLSLVEYSLSSLNAVVPLTKCWDTKGGWSLYKTFIAGKFPLIVQVVPHSMWLSLALLYINVLCTFLWNYVDILIIVISTLLATRFERFNQFLERARGKDFSAMWWRSAREEYNSLAMLTKKMDMHLSPVVFLSFASNLYFICLQLLYNMMPKEDVVSLLYFYFSFLWLLVRAALVSIRAASVYERSLGPVDVLYSVSSRSFCIEVERLLVQTTTDTVALSGCRFFWVTRSLILTLAGTVATYEIVLVQFNAQMTGVAHNKTLECLT